jgi:hypothetical protein
MQTNYALAPSVGRLGMLASSMRQKAIAKVASVAIPFGHLAVRDASDLLVKLPTSKAEVEGAALSGGVAIGSHAIVCDPAVTLPTFPVNKELAVLREGQIFVKVEEAVSQGDQAYVRFANGVLDTALVQKGAFRKSPDGVAQVATLTPAVANSSNYKVTIWDAEGKLLKSAQIVSDGSATAAEIVTALDRLPSAPSRVSRSAGTTTLILTASVAGEGFSVDGGENLAVVATQANSQSAAKLKGCHYDSSASAGELAILDANLGGN